MSKVIVDVRETDEYAAGHVPGAVNIPLSQVKAEGLPNNVSKDDQVIVYCNSGNRSGVAMHLLRDMGYKNVVNGISQSHVEQNNL